MTWSANIIVNAKPSVDCETTTCADPEGAGDPDPLANLRKYRNAGLDPLKNCKAT